MTTDPAAHATSARLRRKRLGLGFRVGAAAAAIIVLGSTAWIAMGWAGNRREFASLDKAIVSPRNFSVVLKEKGELKAAKSTDVVCEVEGRSTIISLIPEGTAVKQGDLLVQLASAEIEDRIRQDELKEANAITAVEVARTQLDVQRDQNLSSVRKSTLNIELARLELAKYEKGDWEQKLKDAQIAIDQATILLERRLEDFNAAKELHARKFITKTDYDEDEFNYQKAIWDLDKARKAKEVLETYTHVAELRQKQSNEEEAVKEHERTVKNAEAEELQKLRSFEGKEKELSLIQDQLKKLRYQKDKCRIVAPTQGFVLYFSGDGGRFMSNDSQIREGATVHERQVLLSLPDTSTMLVVVRVHEAKTNKLSLGQKASVTVEGLPGRVFTGTVTKIAALADTQNRWLNPDLKEYETEITLDQNDPALKPGVTAYSEIMVETVENRLAVPVQSVYSRSGKRYVFRADRNPAQFTEVKLGAIGAEWAEVDDGIKEGDAILLAFSDEHKRLIPEEAGAGNGGGASRPGDPQRRMGPPRDGSGGPRGPRRGPDGAGKQTSAAPGSDAANTTQAPSAPATDAAAQKPGETGRPAGQSDQKAKQGASGSNGR